jgi:putative flippase GtrA
VFWAIYGASGALSAAVALLAFHMALQIFDRPYEEASVVAGALAMPINWLVGEQLTWGAGGLYRALRACRSGLACTAGLIADAAAVHLAAHVWGQSAHWSEVCGLAAGAMCSGPINRLWTWSSDLARLLR